MTRETPEELKATGRNWKYFKEAASWNGHWWYDELDMVLIGDRYSVVLHRDSVAANVYDADTFAEAWKIANAMMNAAREAQQ